MAVATLLTHLVVIAGLGAQDLWRALRGRPQGHGWRHRKAPAEAW